MTTEAARAVCREAFERVGAPSLIERLQPQNHASAAVPSDSGCGTSSIRPGGSASSVGVPAARGELVDYGARRLTMLRTRRLLLRGPLLDELPFIR